MKHPRCTERHAEMLEPQPTELVWFVHDKLARLSHPRLAQVLVSASGLIWSLALVLIWFVSCSAFCSMRSPGCAVENAVGRAASWQPRRRW